jgi:predicted DNA-binding transcriptional regulator
MSNRLKNTAELKQRDREDKLARMLSIIQENPGIRASEINREMSIEHTWNLRSALIKRGLVRKEKKGAAVHYYVIQT